MELNPDAGIALFTDGSAYYRNGSGGWAWVAVDAYEGQYHESGAAWDTTSNRMEMTAAINGLNAIAEQLGSCDVLIYSDSEYLVLGNQDPTRKRNANIDLWLSVELATSKHTYIEWNHVKGHSNIFYNELCDQLAGSARKHLVKEKDEHN